MAEKSAMPSASAFLISLRPMMRTIGRARFDSAPMRTCWCAMVVPPAVRGRDARCRFMPWSPCRDRGRITRRTRPSVVANEQEPGRRAALSEVSSVETDARFVDDLDPLAVFGSDEQLELTGRHVDHFSAILLETRLEFRQRLGDRLLQARDNRRWGLGGSEQADPGIDFEIGNAG